MTSESIDDPRELAFLASRRKFRLRLAAAIACVVGTVVLIVGWKVGRHIIAKVWLESNHSRVIWGIEPWNKKYWGGTTVRYLQHWSLSNDKRGSDFRFLSWLHRVEELDLSGAPNLSDADLSVLGSLDTLRTLNLNRIRSMGFSLPRSELLTDSVLEVIRKNRDLEELNLGGQAITDAGLVHLRTFSKLKEIDLRETEVTDAGLDALKALPALKGLLLNGSLVTRNGVKAFELARPDVKVVDDWTP